MNALSRATITHLESLESLVVQWNPRGFERVKSNRPGLAGEPTGSSALGPTAPFCLERFHTRLFLDSTELEGAARDLRPSIERLEAWAELAPERGLPHHLLFQWGSFRFRGVLEELREEWVRFDADGTPVRAWVDLTLRRVVL